MALVGVTISEYAKAVEGLAAIKDAQQLRSALLPVLSTRDEIAVVLEQGNGAASAAELEKLAESDQRLIKLAPGIERIVTQETLKQWCLSRNAGEAAWWWKLHELPPAKPDWRTAFWTIVAALCLTGSIGLVADTFNLLRSVGENPISTLGTLIQAVLAFIAASAFTPSGRKWLIDAFAHFGIAGRPLKGKGRAGLAFIVLVLTFLIRWYLPIGAAYYFGTTGDDLLNKGAVQNAVVAYQQAAILKADSAEAHLALARAVEKTSDYRKAIDEYKGTITLYERQQSFKDEYYEAKIRLARLLILNENDYAAVLTLLAHPEDVIPRLSERNNETYMYFWFSYLAWAELELKHNEDALTNLKSALQRVPAGATARYLTGRVFDEAKLNDKAREQWKCFIRTLQKAQLKQAQPGQSYGTQLEDEVPPEWLLIAQAKLQAKVTNAPGKETQGENCDSPKSLDLSTPTPTPTPSTGTKRDAMP